MSTNQSSARLRELADFLDTRPEYEKVSALSGDAIAVFDLRDVPMPGATAALLMHDLGGEWKCSQSITNDVPGDAHFDSVGFSGPMGYVSVGIRVPALTEAVSA